MTQDISPEPSGQEFEKRRLEQLKPHHLEELKQHAERLKQYLEELKKQYLEEGKQYLEEGTKKLQEAFANLQRACDVLECKGFSRPQDVYDWVRLALALGLPLEDTTLKDVFMHALAWAERIETAARIRARIKAELKGPATCRRRKRIAAADEYVFARDGDGWFVRAFGEQGHFKRLRGLEYIAKLLEGPGEPVLMTHLVGGRTGRTTAEDAEAHGLAVGASPQPKADRDTMAELRRKIAECDQGIEDARRKGDPVVADAMEREREQLVAHVNALTRPGGQSRAFAADTDRLRVAIYRNLERAYAALRKGSMPKTADHLERAISAQGDCYVYLASPRLEWNLKL